METSIGPIIAMAKAGYIIALSIDVTLIIAGIQLMKPKKEKGLNG